LAPFFPQSKTLIIISILVLSNNEIDGSRMGKGGLKLEIIAGLGSLDGIRKWYTCDIIFLHLGFCVIILDNIWVIVNKDSIVGVNYLSIFVIWAQEGCLGKNWEIMAIAGFTETAISSSVPVTGYLTNLPTRR